jgi:hypothetical protein
MFGPGALFLVAFTIFLVIGMSNDVPEETWARMGRSRKRFYARVREFLTRDLPHAFAARRRCWKVRHQCFQQGQSRRRKDKEWLRRRRQEKTKRPL